MIEEGRIAIANTYRNQLEIRPPILHHIDRPFGGLRGLDPKPGCDEQHDEYKAGQMAHS